jgi:hypothetical protein
MRASIATLTLTLNLWYTMGTGQSTIDPKQIVEKGERRDDSSVCHPAPGSPACMIMARRSIADAGEPGPYHNTRI